MLCRGSYDSVDEPGAADDGLAGVVDDGAEGGADGAGGEGDPAAARLDGAVHRVAEPRHRALRGSPFLRCPPPSPMRWLRLRVCGGGVFPRGAARPTNACARPCPAPSRLTRISRDSDEKGCRRACPVLVRA